PMLGPPPLLRGEDERAYDDLLASLTGHLKPSDPLEEMWLREIIDLTWEHMRWRRQLAHFLDVVLREKLEEIIGPLLDDQSVASSLGGSLMARIGAACQRQTGEPELLR